MEEKEIKELLSTIGAKDLDILTKELTNSSEFERNITQPQNTEDLEKLVNVDIFKGIQELLNLTKDGIGDISSAYKMSGIQYASQRIRHYLVESKIANKVLVEYSLLSSTLNPDNPDKLQCCSFIIDTQKEGSESAFKKSVEKWYTKCIDYTAETQDVSLYQHPNFLYNILIDSPSRKEEFFNNQSNYYQDGRGLTITRLKGHNDVSKFNNISPLEDDKIVYFKEHENIYLEAFSLERQFNEMLVNAKRFSQNRKIAKLKDIQEFLHSCCHYTISLPMNGEKDKSSYYISFPIYGSRASNQLDTYKINYGNDNFTPLQGIGACFIYFEPNPQLMSSDSHNELIVEVAKKVSYEIGKFIRFISANYLFNLGLRLQLNARKEAIKSARAAIMSRNMSHNLGSHVMSYLKQNLSSVNNIFNDRILALLVNDIDSLKIDDEIKKAIKDGDQGILPFLVGLGQFISYIQERQDFIATIATDFIPYLSSVNFKDFIYDELNPDKRYERHSTRKNYKTDNILLGNIARSEGLGRKTSPTGNVALNNIVIKFRDFDGDPVEKQDNQGHPTGKALEGREKEFNTLKEMRPYSFSLPGGVVGRQAIFSIAENVIRNAAKHGNWREKDQLELTFNIFTKEEVENTTQNAYLDDNAEAKGSLSLREVFTKFYIPAKDAKDLYFITLTDNLSMDETKLEKLRKAIDEPLINDRGEMNEASKGLKEMRISSTWLRTLKEGEAYNPIKYKIGNNGTLVKIPENSWKNIDVNQNAPILYARMSDGHLQYIFCVLRPKKVAIVSPRFSDTDNLNIDEACIDYNKKAFLLNSWGAYSPKQYHDERNKSYEFVIFDDVSENEENIEKDYRYDAMRHYSSSRFWRLSKIEGLNENKGKELFDKIKNLTEDDINIILSVLYKKLSNYEKGDYILIDDKTALGNVKRDSQIGKYIKSKHVHVQDGINEKGIYKFIYRTHHDSKTQYDNFIKSVDLKVILNNIFVESITGNNSTDRLIRNECLDDFWFYKHLHAMKEQIAIFDERLFTKLFGLEEAHLRFEEKVIVSNDNFYDYAEKYCSTRSISDEQVDWLYNEDNRDAAIKEIQESLNNEKQAAQSINEINSKTGVIPIVYKQKGIFLFTLIQDPAPENQNIFNLYGLSNTPSLANSYCKKIASLSWDKTKGLSFGGDISFVDNKYTNEYKRFDRISIHQGLLDKLYEVFGIKDSPDDKQLLTNQFFNAFSSLAKKDNGTPNNFLPGMCIHSGRSKPSKIDMPQELPFIQYASIENAVLDCKYSLVELLDFARYE